MRSTEDLHLAHHAQYGKLTSPNSEIEAGRQVKPK